MKKLQLSVLGFVFKGGLVKTLFVRLPVSWIARFSFSAHLVKSLLNETWAAAVALQRFLKPSEVLINRWTTIWNKKYM